MRQLGSAGAAAANASLPRGRHAAVGCRRTSAVLGMAPLRVARSRTSSPESRMKRTSRGGDAVMHQRVGLVGGDHRRIARDPFGFQAIAHGHAGRQRATCIASSRCCPGVHAGSRQRGRRQHQRIHRARPFVPASSRQASPPQSAPAINAAHAVAQQHQRVAVRQRTHGVHHHAPGRPAGVSGCGNRAALALRWHRGRAGRSPATSQPLGIEVRGHMLRSGRCVRPIHARSARCRARPAAGATSGCTWSCTPSAAAIVWGIGMGHGV